VTPDAQKITRPFSTAPVLLRTEEFAATAGCETSLQDRSHNVTIRPRSLALSGLALALALVVSVAAQQPTELLIRNGLIVTATGRTQGDVRIRNGTVAELGRDLTAGTGARVIDATGKLVLPGGIDPHVHLGMRPGIAGSDDYTSGSRAALAGGVTTIGNFVAQTPDEDLTVTLSKAGAAVKAEAIADVLLHATVSDPATVSPAAIAMLAKGYTLKIFTSQPKFDTNLERAL
jgi:dihydropyrimidinase